MRCSLYLSIRENYMSFANKMGTLHLSRSIHTCLFPDIERTERNCLALFSHAAVSQVEVYY